VNHRHLLPDEIDLLLDNEEGFGVAPLRLHLDECGECRARYDRLARLVVALEALPHVPPAPRFADRIMSQVQVFEPWHVALRDAVQRFVPQSSLGRVSVGATAGVMAVVMTFVAVWLGRRADAVLFLVNLVADRTRQGLTSLVLETARALFGAGAADAVRNGGSAAMLAAGAGLAVLVVGVAYGVKFVATTGRSRRV
jgi:hypothetical protein